VAEIARPASPSRPSHGQTMPVCLRAERTPNMSTHDTAPRTAAAAAAIGRMSTTILRSTVVFFLLISAIAIFGISRYHSIRRALSVLRDQSLIIDDTEKTIVHSQQTPVSNLYFDITNLKTYPIKIIGSNNSCDCVSTNDLPMVIAPHDTARLGIAVSHRRNDPASYSRTIVLYTDVQNQQEIPLKINVRPE
jgi:hypothetical protein